jgi:hypothetical protein
MKLRINGLVTLTLVSLSARSEEKVCVWLRMPPRPAEEIQVIAEGPSEGGYCKQRAIAQPNKRLQPITPKDGAPAEQ